MIRIVHGSDLHFGKPHHPGMAEAFLEAATGLEPHLVVLSGDFTQRAKVREYEEAERYLDRFRSETSAPVVVTPGNHDVPLYRILERIFAPFRNYQRYVSEDLDAVTRIPGLTVVSLNSAAPRRAIVNGRIRPGQLEFARRALADTPDSDLKAVVAHHHLAPAPDYQGDSPLPGARRILDAFQGMGVELILGGHLHRAYIGNSLDVYPGRNRERGIVIVQSGTTTSSRGRAREEAKNSFNLIEITEGQVEVLHYMHFRDAGGFEPFSAHTFPRWSRRWLSPKEASETAPAAGRET